MQMFRPASTPAQLSLMYITVGCLTLVWTCVWYFYLVNHPPESPGVYYWVVGLALSAVTLVVIGLTVGHIGRSARTAESPNDLVTAPSTSTEQVAQVATPVQAVPANVRPMVSAPTAQPVAVNSVQQQ